MTRRLTPEQVLAAYEQTGLAVARGTYLMPPRDGRPACGCPIGAVVASELHLRPHGDDHGMKQTAIHCGFSEGYVVHFTSTFDSGGADACREGCEPCEDAVAVLAALRGKGMVS